MKPNGTGSANGAVERLKSETSPASNPAGSAGASQDVAALPGDRPHTPDAEGAPRRDEASPALDEPENGNEADGVSEHWIGRTPDCHDGLCEFESTLSTFWADGCEWELYECRHCGRGEDRRVYDDEDED